MQLNTFTRYDQSCKVLELDTSVSPPVWVEGPTIKVQTRPLDRLGMILMITDTYFREDRYRFTNHRNHMGTVLYPFPGQPEGRVFQTFDASVRLDAWGVVQHYSYALAKVDEEPDN